MSMVNIFSGSFVGGRDVAQELAREMGTQLATDDDLISKAAAASGAAEAALRKAIYGKPSVFNMFSREREIGITSLKLAMLELTMENSAVFLGYGSLLVPRNISHVLQVCLAADASKRAEKAAATLNVSPKEAMSRIHRDDEAAFRWAEYVMDCEPWDPSKYDILIPMGKTGVEKAVKLILDHASSGTLAFNESSIRAAKDALLAAQVEQALVKEGHTPKDLSVSASKGKVKVQINKKVMLLGRLQEELAKLAQKVDGVKDVDVEAGPGYYQADVYRRADFKLPSKVLLVDDEREFVQTLSERLLLREIGSAVVYDGEQALKLVSEDEPEVMVLDLKMPGIDGVEVLKRTKRDHPEVEVIILTGHGSDRDRQQCMELGAFAYLEKPVDIEKLSQVMQEAYDKIKARQE